MLKYMKTILENKELKRHLHSFAKTYLTVFLALLLAGMSEGKSLYDLDFILKISELSLVALLRNVYKGLTE